MTPYQKHAVATISREYATQIERASGAADEPEFDAACGRIAGLMRRARGLGIVDQVAYATRGILNPSKVPAE